ncbi:MAG: iron-sulfur cluster assembly protein, partial [Eudoraea sp.]
MKLDKKEILKALETITVPGEGKNMVESGAVNNIQLFGDEVVVDITINNPSLQARKKTEVEILKAIHREVYEKAKITVNIKVDA